MSLKSTIIHNFQSIPGSTIKRRLLAIESDDWGSIRMPSREIRDSLIKKGFTIDRCPFSNYDSLASADDLQKLYEILAGVKDKNGNPAVITANTVVANPDFKKIAESVSTYASEEGLATMTERYQDLSDSGNANRAFSRMIVTLRDYGIMIGAILLSYLCYKRKDEDSIRLMTLIILMFSMANIASSADNGDRFIFTTDVFVIYYLFYLVYKDKKENVYGLSGYGSFVINILFTITAIYGLSYIMVTRATYNYTQLLLGNVISAYIFNN